MAENAKPGPWASTLALLKTFQARLNAGTDRTAQLEARLAAAERRLAEIEGNRSQAHLVASDGRRLWPAGRVF
jgi:hypothetical protein